MTHVVCVGHLMVDVLAVLSGPLVTGSDTAAEVRYTGGGAAANVACWLSAAGAGATVVGRVGDDPAGVQVLADLRSAGVGTAVAVDPGHTTGTCLVLVAPDGERTMVPSVGANAVGGDPDLVPTKADALYLSGYALFTEPSRSTSLEILRRARGHGWPVTVDAASAAPLAVFGAEAFLDAAGACLLLANVDEAGVLTGRANPHEAAMALGQRCGQAVVKCGSAGAVWSDGTDTRSASAATVRAVDTTGAGDAFAAGFLAATDAAIDERLRAAAALAARAVGQLGARP